MSNWRAMAEEALRGENTRNDRNARAESGASVPSVPSVPPLQALKLCQGELAALDPAKPLHGLDPARWRQLVEDAGWLIDGFAPAAFRNGWTIADLFGLWWYQDGGRLAFKDAWGGIADRLQGARSLVMDADRARWRRMFTREPDQYARGTYPNLRPLWEPSE